ncbi:LysR family transcriptional regulator [Fastidiosibacter lacustris]|uniref:LysR family transcriptional regulator n=1 Tax=Fastidiosibacter lacustris TaxID=2056695 RepID=UPI000E355688|nr:LysR family transcriptional regulator [Fastidiosibacter lacustris]
MINLSPLLQAFIAVEKAGTVHSAADVLHLTQTAVTQRIKSLEEKLNVSLFVRSRKGMQLTSEGQILLRYCHDIQKLENTYLRSLNMHQSENIIPIKIVSSSTLMKTRIVEPVAKIAKAYPQLRFHLQIQDIENRHDLLKTGKVDLAIVNNNFVSKEMCIKTLQPERYVLIVPKEWQSRTVSDIIASENIIDFDPSDTITFCYLEKYQLLTLARKDRHFVNSPDQLAQLVGLSLGYTVVTKQFYQQYCDPGRIIVLNPNDYYDHEASLCWYDRGILPNYFRQLIDLIC